MLQFIFLYKQTTLLWAFPTKGENGSIQSLERQSEYIDPGVSFESSHNQVKTPMITDEAVWKKTSN